MKRSLAAIAALLLVSSSARAQDAAKKPSPKPTPLAAPGLQASTSTAAPKGATVSAEDMRLLTGTMADPFELERIGLAAANANELDRAKAFFERAWTVGQLPTAQYNLACLEARKGRTDAAFLGLEKAIAAGFDDGTALEKDPDLAPLRGKGKWASIVSGAEKNRSAGDAAAVKEGVFLVPKTAPVSAILVLLHDKASDPYAVANPFADVALSYRMVVAAPRGPGKSAVKRYGWGSADRAAKAIRAAIDAAKKKSKAGDVPILLVGVGRGGTEALTAAAKLPPRTFSAVGSIGGPFDPGATKGDVRSLRGVKLVLGSSRDASPNEINASRRGVEALRQAGFDPAVLLWPGSSSGFPPEAAKAAKDVLDAFANPPAGAR